MKLRLDIRDSAHSITLCDDNGEALISTRQQPGKPDVLHEYIATHYYLEEARRHMWMTARYFAEQKSPYYLDHTEVDYRRKVEYDTLPIPPINETWSIISDTAGEWYSPSNNYVADPTMTDQVRGDDNTLVTPLTKEMLLMMNLMGLEVKRNLMDDTKPVRYIAHLDEEQLALLVGD